MFPAMPVLSLYLSESKRDQALLKELRRRARAKDQSLSSFVKFKLRVAVSHDEVPEYRVTDLRGPLPRRKP